MKSDPESEESVNIRQEARTEGDDKASVEFIPGTSALAYHFKLRDFSSKGFGILVRRDSRVLEHIKAGDVISMKYHPDEATASPVIHKTQIKHISPSEDNQDHILVGLMILD